MVHLFDIPLVGRLLRSPWTLRLCRLLLLALLLGMILLGWNHHDIAGVPAADPLMYTHGTSHLFWVCWMMGGAILAVVAGRFWCAICPLGWVNELSGRIGLRRRLPSALASKIPVALVLMGLQLLVYGFAIHRYPDYTAWLLGTSLCLAIVLGLLFFGRSFCHLLCPAGALFGLYAPLSLLGLRVRDKSRCRSCTQRSCVATQRFWGRFHLGQAQLFWPMRRPGCPAYFSIWWS